MAFVLAFAPSASAANLYVVPGGTGDGSIGNPTHLQQALNTAVANGQNDIIFLQASGTDYGDTNGAGFHYAAVGVDTTTLTLSGGWNSTFTEQTDDPSATRLSGENARRVLKITGDGGNVDIAVTLEWLTIMNGRTNTYTAFPGETGYGAGMSVMNLNGARLKLVMNNCDVKNNATLHASSYGGGLYATCDFELHNVSFQTNSTLYVGGGLMTVYFAPYTAALAPLVDNCSFEANTTKVGNGAGGAHIYLNNAAVIRESEFLGRGGVLSSGGGAVNCVNGSHAVFERCLFHGNIGDYWGGAIHFWDADAEVLGCLFVENRSGATGDGAGGALTMYDNSPATPRRVNVINSTFFRNFTQGYQGSGGAIHNRVQAISITNCIFWENGKVSTPGGSPTNYGGFYALIDETGTGTVSYSDVQGGLQSTGYVAGSGNLNVNPDFAPSDDDYHLQSGSPCVDAGSNAVVPTTLKTDFEDDPRVFAFNNRESAVVDIGWDEYFDAGLNMTSPEPGTLWINNGTGLNITWTSANVGGNVRLDLWQGERFTGHEVMEIAASVPCTNHAFTWVPPASLPDASDYAIAIDSLRYPTLGHGIGPITIIHPASRPDVRIGLTTAASTGNNIYNTTGASQTQAVTIRHGGGVKNVYVAVQNDGNATESFRVQGTKGNSLFKVKYFKGKSEVSAAVQAGKFKTGSLKPAEICLLKVQITAVTGVKGKKSTLNIEATSTYNTSRKDKVTIKAKST
jgi:hypothetical protein